MAPLNAGQQYPVGTDAKLHAISESGEVRKSRH